MANLDIGTPVGVVDKRLGWGSSGATNLAEIANMTSTSALRTRLQAISGTKFTTARLNSMSKNDMLYALRMESNDKAGI